MKGILVREIGEEEKETSDSSEQFLGTIMGGRGRVRSRMLLRNWETTKGTGRDAVRKDPCNVDFLYHESTG